MSDALYAFQYAWAISPPSFRPYIPGHIPGALQTRIAVLLKSRNALVSLNDGYRTGAAAGQTAPDARRSVQSEAGAEPPAPLPFARRAACKGRARGQRAHARGRAEDAEPATPVAAIAAQAPAER